MSNIKLVPVKEAEKVQFIMAIQAAFQKSYETTFGHQNALVLPSSDIEASFNTPGSRAYFAFLDGEIVGGTVLVIDDVSHYNKLELLYVADGVQSKGVGQKIWQALEAAYPGTKIWETHTPYYDKRNIHFYVNRCGFKIVEFFNIKHRDPHQEGEQVGGLPLELGINFFRFEKEMGS